MRNGLPTAPGQSAKAESGTGKELVARAIHDRGSRKESALIKVNCGAVPDSPTLSNQELNLRIVWVELALVDLDARLVPNRTYGTSLIGKTTGKHTGRNRGW